jgi:hypothetical protein
MLSSFDSSSFHERVPLGFGRLLKPEFLGTPDMKGFAPGIRVQKVMKE